jgi:tRNA threonylcarbamoyladenosine biosynthesis protein TsaB
MLVLALDSAAAGCSVALLRGATTLLCRQEAMARGQDARLLPLVQTVLAEAGVAFAALGRIAVLRGPGSFTGLRIGLAAARGLGLGLGIPVLGIDRFVLYRQACPAMSLLVVLESRRSENFCQFFPAEHNAAPPFLASANQYAAYDRPDVTVCGDGAGAYGWQQAKPAALALPEAVYAGRLAQQLAPESAPPLPLYLRPPDVSHGPTPPVEEGPWLP